MNISTWGTAHSNHSGPTGRTCSLSHHRTIPWIIIIIYPTYTLPFFPKEPEAFSSSESSIINMGIHSVSLYASFCLIENNKSQLLKWIPKWWRLLASEIYLATLHSSMRTTVGKWLSFLFGHTLHSFSCPLFLHIRLPLKGVSMAVANCVSMNVASTYFACF